MAFTYNWPTTLPHCFLREGYEDSMADNVQRDQFDVGPAGVRARSTAAPYPISGRMKMTTAQWAILKTFVTTTLLQRTQAFGFPEPFEDPSVSPAPTILVRMTTAPARVPLGAGQWLVTLTLEVLPSA